jgi:hypothetical protein
MARSSPPPIVVAELKYQCPGLGIKRFTIPGPTADQAIRKAAAFDPNGPGVPKYIARRCHPVGLELKQRGRGSQTRSLDELGGSRACTKKLHAQIAAVRRQAHDAGRVPSFFAQNAERAARNGDCAFARQELARTKRIIARYKRGG